MQIWLVSPRPPGRSPAPVRDQRLVMAVPIPRCRAPGQAAEQSQLLPARAGRQQQRAHQIATRSQRRRPSRGQLDLRPAPPPASPHSGTECKGAIESPSGPPAVGIETPGTDSSLRPDVNDGPVARKRRTGRSARSYGPVTRLTPSRRSVGTRAVIKSSPSRRLVGSRRYSPSANWPGCIFMHRRAWGEHPDLPQTGRRSLVIPLATASAAFPRKRLVQSFTKRFRRNARFCRGQFGLLVVVRDGDPGRVRLAGCPGLPCRVYRRQAQGFCHGWRRCWWPA